MVHSIMIMIALLLGSGMAIAVGMVLLNCILSAAVLAKELIKELK